MNELEPSVTVDIKVNILLTEYAQSRESERTSRGHLYTINAFAAFVVSGLIVGIKQFDVELLTLVSPVVVYLIGFMYSSESLRIHRIVAHLKTLEEEVRKLIPEGGGSMPKGFETATLEGGFLSMMRFSAITLVSAAFYAVFYALSFYLLATSVYDTSLKIGLIMGYLISGLSFWAFDLWINRDYLFQKNIC